jgi:hypothetical protein
MSETKIRSKQRSKTIKRASQDPYVRVVTNPCPSLIELSRSYWQIYSGKLALPKRILKAPECPSTDWQPKSVQQN